MKLLRHWRLIAIVFLVVVGLGLLHTAWPLLFYPSTTLTLAKKSPLPADKVTHAVAGIAQTDITPPIGMPKFGYSAWARPADGFRTHLKARAFYLNAPGDTPMALVQLDLGAGSLPLHHRVAELVAEKTDVPAHALSLLVTHTHSGPGQYLGSDFYNVFGSNKPGFDPALFDFLSQRIAKAVIHAYRDRREARFAVGQTKIWGLTRNRSLGAWARNHPERDLQDLDPYRAVNPRLTLLRVDQRTPAGQFHPAGALSLFSIHGTAIPPFTRPYHGDVWTWLSSELENDLKATNPAFIHAAAQATHADNNPAWTRNLRGDKEARRLGKALGRQASALFHRLESRLSPTLQLGIASRELDLLGDIDTGRFGLCERAVAGAAVVGAANGDEVFPISYLPFLEEGWPRRFFTDGCQGVKQWMLSKLQLLLPPERFPHRALFQVIRINDLVIVPLPWEITLESGNRLRQAVRDTLPEGRDWTVEISSLANGYFGYAVTPEEYGAQYYEGGHTLYGPHTLDFLIGQSRRLSQDLQHRGEVDDLPEKSHFELVSRQYFPEPALPRVPVARQWQSAPRFHDATATRSAHWSLKVEAESPAHLPLDQPLLSVHCNGTPAIHIDDQQAALQLRLEERLAPRRARYRLDWFRPDASLHRDCRLHFAATPWGEAIISPILQ